MGGKGKGIKKGGLRIWGQKKTGHQKLKNTSRIVWIGGIPEGTTYQNLKDHAEKKRAPARWAEVYAKGTGVIGYATDQEAAAAITRLNCTKLRGSILEADHYEGANQENEVPKKKKMIFKSKMSFKSKKHRR